MNGGSSQLFKVNYYFNTIFYSPFKLKVRPKTEPDRVKIVGPVTTSKGGVLASMPTEFTVDASQAGTGNVDVQVLVNMMISMRCHMHALSCRGVWLDLVCKRYWFTSESNVEKNWAMNGKFTTHTFGLGCKCSRVIADLSQLVCEGIGKLNTRNCQLISLGT